MAVDGDKINCAFFSNFIFNSKIKGYFRLRKLYYGEKTIIVTFLEVINIKYRKFKKSKTFN